MRSSVVTEIAHTVYKKPHIAKNLRQPQPHFCHFDRWQQGSSTRASASFMQLAPEAAHYVKECIMTAKGSFKVTNSGNNRKPTCKFLLVNNANLCPIAHYV